METCPRFPQELVDIVIDHLHDDKETLRKCSLICWNWIPSSTLHLFSRLSWPPCGHIWDMSVSESKECYCSPDQQFSDFTALLSVVASRRISWAVKTLRLSSYRKRGLRKLVLPTPLLFTILEQLPRLRCLELRACNLEPSVSTPTTAQLRSLERLIFSSDSLQCPDALHLLSSFRHVSTLEVKCHWGAPQAPTMTAGLPVEVHTLKFPYVSYSTAPYHPSDILLRNLRPRLKSASIRAIQTQGMFPELANFIVDCPNLERLDYEVRDLPTALRTWPRLRHLRIGCYVGDEGHHLRTAWDSMMRDLETIDTSHIETFQLFILLAGYAPTASDLAASRRRLLSSKDWKPIDTFVNRCRCLTSWQLQVIHRGSSAQSMQCSALVREIAMKKLASSVVQMFGVEAIAR